MTDAPSLAERSAGSPPVTNEDFEAFYLAHRVRLFRALVVVTRDVHAAEEVAQDAFVRVWERWDRVRQMEDPTGYLYRTALNAWFQVHRRAVRAARRTASPGRMLDPLEMVEDRDVLARRLLELPARQRAAPGPHRVPGTRLRRGRVGAGGPAGNGPTPGVESEGGAPPRL